MCRNGGLFPLNILVGGPVTPQGSLWSPWLQYFCQCLEGGVEDGFGWSVEMQCWVMFAARKLAGAAAERMFW